MNALNEPELVEQIVTRERNLMEAEKRGNGPALLRLLAPDFHGVDANGEPVDRQAFVKEFTSQRLHIENARVEGLAVRAFGHVALVSGVVEIQGIVTGNPVSLGYRITDVWVRRVMRWELSASYRFRTR